MENVYRVIAVVLAFGALGQIIDGFAEFFSRFGDVVSDGSPTDPSSFGMFRQGLLGIATSAPTLLICVIFFHMQTFVDAISRLRLQDSDDVSK